MSFLISIVGPTAVGKTQLSLYLARKFGTEILSCDSRQMYRYMDIGTAKPAPEVVAAVPHHFVNTLDPSEEYNAGRFETEAETLLSQLFQTHEVVVAVGGSTLYVDALWNGIDEMPPVKPEIRQDLNERLLNKGLEDLVDELEQVDPLAFEKIDRYNPVRVVRALEVYLSTGTPISTFWLGKKEKERSYTLLKIGLDLNRKLLYERINERVRQMIRDGLVEEVASLLERGYDPALNSLQSIGYQEIIAYLQKRISLDEAIRLIQRNSRRYAKRQLTWYRRYPDVKWFAAGKDSEEEIAHWVEQQMGNT